MHCICITELHSTYTLSLRPCMIHAWTHDTCMDIVLYILISYCDCIHYDNENGSNENDIAYFTAAHM